MMKSGWRMLIAAAAAVQAAASGTAFAQNAVTPAPTSNSTEVGPRQLRDFTLNGTVTRPAQADAPAPAPTAPAPAAQPPRAQPQPSSTTALPPPRAPVRTAPAPAPAPAPGGMTVELPPPSPTAALPATAGAPMELPPAEDTGATFAPDPSGSIPDSPSLLPWLLVAALLGGGAAFYFFRVRPRSQLAGGPQVSEFVAPEAAPPQPAPAPAPRPRAVPPAGGGVVSTGLRPWIEIDFVPERTIIDEQNVAIEFLVTIYNSGGAPARDVLIETAMFNASRTQDQQIGAFFASPAGRGHRVPVVAPLQRVSARSAVTLPRSEIQPLFAEGRPLLVPLVALNALYRWGTNNHGQTSASYLAGKETKTEKLAPFRLDVGPRVFRGLAARAHELKVRN